MLENGVGEEVLRRVRLHPPPGERRGLLLDVADGGQVHAGVAVQRPPRFHLERHSLRPELRSSKLVPQRARDDAGVVLDARPGDRSVPEAWDATAEGVAGHRDPASHVDLGRHPAPPCSPDLGQEPHDLADQLSPVLGLGPVAPHVDVHAAHADAVRSQEFRSQRDQILLGDAGLVLLGQRGHRHLLLQPVGGLGQGGEVGADAGPDDRGPARGLHGPAYQVQLGRRVERDPGPDLDGPVHGLLTLGPFREMSSGRVPPRSAASSSAPPNASHPAPSCERIHRSANE